MSAQHRQQDRTSGFRKLLDHFRATSREPEADALQVAADKWLNHHKQPHLARTRWSESETIQCHLNQKILGRSAPGAKGATLRLKEHLGRGARRAISIGCGTAAKSFALLQQGLVEHFELVEISGGLVEKGNALAQAMGLADRVSIKVTDYRQLEIEERFDLVHWNDSLHHMQNTRDAIRWSRDVLAPGGIFYMNEYVGPKRFQFPDETLAVCSRLRRYLPERYLRDPHDTEKLLRRSFSRILVDRLVAHDPTEAVDSENILPGVVETFPDAEVTLLGGAVYRAVLNGMIFNLDEEKDRHILESVLVADDLMLELGHNHLAVAYARKE